MEQTARMTKSEPAIDTAKAEREARARGLALIGKRIIFNETGFNYVYGKIMSTGQKLTGTVQSWDEVTQCLIVSIAGTIMPRHIKLDEVIREV